MVVARSVFGVGAPEALVIGVVALLVFGPKGLAEAAKSLGGVLRTFQPTLRELQEVSQEFKTVLEDEIGLDELKRDLSAVADPYAAPSAARQKAAAAATQALREDEGAGAASVLDDAKALEAEEAGAGAGAEAEEDLEAMRAASAAAAWGQTPPPTGAAETYPATLGEVAEGLAGDAGGGGEAPAPDLAAMSVEELEAELARRKGDEA